MLVHETCSVFISDGGQIVIVLGATMRPKHIGPSLREWSRLADATPSVDHIQAALLPIHAMFAECFTPARERCYMHVTGSCHC
jgi:hypothetical protein